MKTKTVNDVGSMSLCSVVDILPNFYIVTLLNSTFLFNYYREFINCTVNIQINDIRQIPIIIPTKEQLVECQLLFNKISELKKYRSTRHNIFKYTEKEIEQNLDDFVKKLYHSI